MSTYIFDFDGTLADSFPIACDILLKHAKYLGCKQLSSSDLDRLRNMDVREILKYLEIPYWKIPWVLKKLRKLGKQNIDEIIIFPEWIEVLKTLKNNKHTLGIISSNTQETIQYILRKYALDKLFDFIVCEKLLFGKSRSLKKLIKRLSLSRDDTYYIGDEVRDIEAAQENKIHAIAVAWGLNSIDRLKLAGPELLITHPDELKTAVF